MPATYMLRKHLRSQELANRPEAVAERKRNNEACRRAREERMQSYPHITPENCEEVNDFQNARIEFWRAALTDKE